MTNYLKKKSQKICQKINLIFGNFTTVMIGICCLLIATENKIYAQSTPIPISGGTAIISPSTPQINAGVIITGTHYWDGTHTGTSYTPSSNNYFSLSNFTALGSSTLPVAGIFSNFSGLVLDLAGQPVAVTNSLASGADLQYVAAGFGYASATKFAGTISTTGVLGNFTATSDNGAAYGMIFANEDMTGISSLDTKSFIRVGTLTATTKSAGDVAVGFQAFNVAGASAAGNDEAFISITNIITSHEGTGGSTVGVLLGDVSGTVVGTLTYNSSQITGSNGINITGTIKDVNTDATGLHATEISSGAFVQLGTITLNSDANDEGYLYGVQVSQVGGGTAPGASTSTTIGRIAGTLEVGNISLGNDKSAKAAIGLLLKNDVDITNSVAPGITATGEVTLSDITINTGSGAAVGVSLGSYEPSSSTIDFGYAAEDKLILNGDINVTSNSNDAVGIFAGQLSELTVKYNIIANGTSDASYGIRTTGKTESDGSNDKASVINITDSNAIITGTTKSILLGSTSGDIVNLNVSGWLNGSEAFTMEGVETFYVMQDVDFTTVTGIKDSKRGTATLSTVDTITNISSGKTFKILDTFFDAGGSQVIKGGTLEITHGSSVGFVDKLTFDSTNVTFEAGAQLCFNAPTTTPSINITNNSTITFKRDGNNISGIARSEWATFGVLWENYPIALTVSGGSTLKFEGDLDNGDAAWYLHPFEASIGSGGATIDVATGMIVETGKILKDGVTNVSMTKNGGGELKLIDVFDLDTGGSIILNDGILSVHDEGTNYDPTLVAGEEIIKNSPNLAMFNDAKFKLNDLNATLGQLTGTNNTEILLEANRLAVNSGTFSGKITGLSSSQIRKDGTGYLTINGDNSAMAGALIQNNGTVELQSNWGGSSLAGHIDQDGGKFIFNGNGNGSTVKVFGDAKFDGEVEIKGKVIAKSFTLEQSADITISVTPLNQDWSDLITVTTSFDQFTRDKLMAEANDAGLLYSRTGTFNPANTAFNIEYETTTLSDYAHNKGMTRNIGRMGSLVDGLMVKYPDFAATIYSLDQEDVDGILTSLLGSELAANAQFLAFSNPQYRVFNHLRSLDRSTPSGILGQTGFRILTFNYDLWFEGNFRSEQVKRDSDSWGYDIDRGGMFVGLDAKFGDRIISGLVFSYGNPHISNRVGKITADDISFGIYSRFRLFWECSVNVFLGYGVQNYKYNHAGYTTDYKGDSLYASFEVVRPVPFYLYGQLIPIFAIDFQKAWSDAFVEGDPNNFGLHIGKSDIDQAILRFGLNSKIMPTRQFQLRTRLQYGLQVAGDLYAAANTSFVVNPTITQTLKSVKRGRNNINVGIGTDVYTIDELTKFFVDYDYIYNKKSNSHSFQIGITTTR
ncbi:MAG: autotransporter domain-containing protein [Planctomycetaceae bacterium]|jgi:hypothetical protein|nr:autotransporter domain-containing protein [Planctomycetaceae bacterium]